MSAFCNLNNQLDEKNRTENHVGDPKLRYKLIVLQGLLSQDSPRCAILALDVRATDYFKRK